MKGFLEETAEFLIDYATDRLEKQGKIINNEYKGGMFKFMDLILKGDESDGE